METNATNQIPERKFESVTEELFFRHRRGEITLQDYQIQNALWVAQHVEKYPPKAYSAMNAQINIYVSARLNGTERNPSNAHLLGLWIASIQLLFEQNQADHSLLIWSKRKLSEAGMTHMTERLDRAIERFDKNIFPSADFRSALCVQKMDSKEK